MLADDEHYHYLILRLEELWRVSLTFLNSQKTLALRHRIMVFFQHNFFLPPYTAAPGFEPTSVELHQTGIFEGRSSN